MLKNVHKFTFFYAFFKKTLTEDAILFENSFDGNNNVEK
jgi:hypothetical protein